MDAAQFDTLARSLLDRRSRRGALTAVVGAALGVAGLAGSDARRKKKPCPPCKKRKKGKCQKVLPDGTVCKGGACQGGACMVRTASCGYNGVSPPFGNIRRFAQTFLAPGSGPLTTATISLRSNPAAFSLTFEIRAVDQAGLPSLVAFAASTVSDVPITVYSPTSLRNVTATFISPATLVLGQPYALVVTGPANAPYFIQVNDGFGGIDACTDGQAFRDDQATNDFRELVSAYADLVYTVTVG